MNPVAMVTGSSRGIGRGIAVELARHGWNLVINFQKNQEAAESAKEECLKVAALAGRSMDLILVQADVSTDSGRHKLLDECRARFGRLDLLVNNAGKAPSIRADLLDCTETSFDEVLDTNLKGPFFLAQQAAHWMLQLKSEAARPYRPKIVFISSISAYTASITRGEYCIAKAGISMAAKLFAVRLAASEIAVFEIRPGIIATDMTEPVRAKYDHLIQEGLTPIARWGTPEDVAQAVLAVAEHRLPFSTGEIINVDGGFHLQRL